MIDDLRARIRAQYGPGFDFTIVSGVPFAATSKPAAQSRIALISTAGLYLDDQEPFDRGTMTGDCTYRRVRVEDDLTRLRLWWDTEQRQPASQDLNSAFPLALLGEFCELAPVHYSFSGSIPDPIPLIEETAPAVARELEEAEVDAVLLAPS